MGASTTIAQYVLPRLLAQFCGEHPRVRPSLISGNTEHIVECVERREICLGFIEGPPRTRDLHAQPFLVDELVLIVPIAHEWAERGMIAATELKREALLHGNDAADAGARIGNAADRRDGAGAGGDVSQRFERRDGTRFD